MLPAAAFAAAAAADGLRPRRRATTGLAVQAAEAPLAGPGAAAAAAAAWPAAAVFLLCARARADGGRPVAGWSASPNVATSSARPPSACGRPAASLLEHEAPLSTSMSISPAGASARSATAAGRAATAPSAEPFSCRSRSCAADCGGSVRGGVAGGGGFLFEVRRGFAAAPSAGADAAAPVAAAAVVSFVFAAPVTGARAGSAGVDAAITGADPAERRSLAGLLPSAAAVCGPAGPRIGPDLVTDASWFDRMPC